MVVRSAVHSDLTGISIDLCRDWREMELMEILNPAAERAKCYTQFTAAPSDADRSAQLFLQHSHHTDLELQRQGIIGKTHIAALAKKKTHKNLSTNLFMFGLSVYLLSFSVSKCVKYSCSLLLLEPASLMYTSLWGHTTWLQGNEVDQCV